MQKTNPVLRKNITKLEEAGRKNDAPVYTKVAEELKKTDKNRTEVNISKIQRHAEEGDTVLVPGKVLGSGRMDKDVKVAAFSFSRSAMEVLDDAGEPMYIEDLLEENPEGEQVKIIK